MTEDLSRYNPEGSTLRKAQLRMLSILIEVDKICRKHKIDYFVDSGTLLGAVRHGGFIPWDDDLDIAIRREDLPRLRKALQEELPSDMCYQDWTTEENYPMTIAKVRDKHSIFDESYYRMLKERGIYIDIFFVEPSLPLWLRKPIDYVYIRCIRGMNKFSDRFIEIFLGYLCYPITILIVDLVRLWGKLFHVKKLGRQYGWKSSLYVNENVIFPVSEIQYEGHKFYAPHDVDTFLHTLYGDYMQIPPKDKRITHNAPITFLEGFKK